MKARFLSHLTATLLATAWPALAQDDVTAPKLLAARGRTLEGLLLTFSELMDSAKAADVSSYAISGGITVKEAVASEFDGTVLLTTSAQTVGTEYTLAVSKGADLAGNALAAAAPVKFLAKGSLIQGNDGFVVWEAEDYDRNADGHWALDSARGLPSGGFSVRTDNGNGGNEANTRLEYEVKFVKTGTHILWYRASSESGTDDSSWFHLNAERPAERVDANRASMTGFSTQADFVWRSQPQDGGGQMTFQVAQAGVLAIGLAQREDGAYFDKFVITTDPNFNPLDFGPEGPANTRRDGEKAAGGGPQVKITQEPANAEGVEHERLEMTADGSGTEGALIVRQWQRKERATFVDIPGATLATLTIPRLIMAWNGAVVRFKIVAGESEAVSKEASISVKPEATVPTLMRTSGLAQPGRIVLQFSEPLAEATAKDKANYTLTGGLTINEATLLPSQTTVVLTTSNQTVGEKYTVTVNGVTDQAATPNAISNAVGKYYSLGALLPQGVDGMMVFEAENFTTNTDDRWVSDTARGVPSGGMAVVLPNGAGGNEESKLEYDLTFTKTGPHILWYRASGDSGNDDSSWLHLDGVRPVERADANLASMSGFSSQVDYVWRSNPQEGGGQMTFEIATAGKHSIGLARREDGAFFDKFVITTDPEFRPEAFGPFGPGETRQGAPPLPKVEIKATGNAGALTLTPNIADSPRVVAKVEFFAAGAKIGEATAAPFAFLWRDATEGGHAISAILTDDVGDLVAVPAVDITVTAGGGVPAEPLAIASVQRTAAGLVLQWRGGKAPYTVQKLNGTAWEAAGTTNETTATFPLDGKIGLFRIGSP